MSAKTIEDLREHLFSTIAGVKAGTVTIEQAKTIGDLCQVVVNTAKVEVDFVRATDRRESQFLVGATAAATAQTVTTPTTGLPNGILGIRRHVCADD